MSRRVLLYSVIATAWLAIALGVVACGGGGAAARPGEPSASTGAASQVTPSSAVVSGEVNAQGQGASYYFEYGENTSYGSTTPSQNIASEAAFPVTATLSNLNADTTYHYQLVLRTSDGKQIKGGDQTFQTGAEGGGGGGGGGGAGGGTTTGGRATTGPTTAPLTTVQPTTAPLTTVRPTTGPYTTVRPTHGGYTTVQPTTTYTTVQPTTTYTTVQPTGPLTTVRPTTGNP